ncbi:hypothetical protein DCAR_0100438 [Daucus carota subsp. sativus]|uniref:Uncharacterized protein n=1 Tax=Daucus carota subsp. sativus TaxID=79200 RepID=A0A166FNE1_DAUCS|nr:hypothetical protein DCAR_0100438 [Daucus carota subsp. sativus]
MSLPRVMLMLIFSYTFVVLSSGQAPAVLHSSTMTSPAKGPGPLVSEPAPAPSMSLRGSRGSSTSGIPRYTPSSSSQGFAGFKHGTSSLAMVALLGGAVFLV